MCGSLLRWRKSADENWTFRAQGATRNSMRCVQCWDLRTRLVKCLKGSNVPRVADKKMGSHIVMRPGTVIFWVHFWYVSSLFSSLLRCTPLCVPSYLGGAPFETFVYSPSYSWRRMVDERHRALTYNAFLQQSWLLKGFRHIYCCAGLKINGSPDWRPLQL